MIAGVALTEQDTRAADAPEAQGGADSALPEPEWIRVEGDPEAGRALTLDFAGLVAELCRMPDPETGEENPYRAGVDLLMTLRNEARDFGLAAPGVPADAPIAEQIVGLTDEAFEAAEAFLMATEDDAPMGHRAASSGMCALLLELGGLSVREEIRAIRHLPPATDGRIGEIGGEFF